MKISPTDSNIEPKLRALVPWVCFLDHISIPWELDRHTNPQARYQTY